MKRLLALVLSLVMLAGIAAVFAEEDVETLPEAAKINAFGIPTMEELNEMKADADALWDEEDYSGAADAYAELAAKADWMAEILAIVNVPTLGAEGDVDSAVADGVKKVDDLFDNVFAIYRLALIRAGMGFYNTEEYEEALPYLLEALKAIEAADTENWTLCARAVLVIIGEVEAPEAE